MRAGVDYYGGRQDSIEESITTLWRFSDGYTDEGKMVTHTFVCGDEDSVRIWMENCNRIGCCDTATLAIPIGSYNLWFPNAFTPEKETNNAFGVVGTIPFEEYEIFTYNRKGLLVFTSSDPEERWDGNDKNGNPCPQGAFVYLNNLTYQYKSC